MRLQLIALAALVPCAAAAQELDEPGSGTAASRVLVYDDDDATTVVTSAADAEVAVPGGAAVGAHVLVDQVSSASVDVVSAATERWTENRVEAGARGRAVLRGYELRLGYMRSQENDWVSDAARVGVSRELLARNLRLDASYGVTLNRVGRAEDPAFERSLDAHMAELGASQLVDRWTRVGATYTVQALDGYQASPYRFIADGDERTPERHPELRVRHAWSVYGVRSVTAWLAARTAYRFYADDWGIHSHTATVTVIADGDTWWRAELGGRFYTQTGAAFYRDAYTETRAHMTADRELGPFWDAGGTATLAAAIGPVLADVTLGVIHYRFEDFAALPRRTAVLAGGGVRATW